MADKTYQQIALEYAPYNSCSALGRDFFGRSSCSYGAELRTDLGPDGLQEQRGLPLIEWAADRAPAASDRSAPAPSVRRTAARQHPLPDAGIGDVKVS
jgi:hypothetical protein